MDFNVYIAFVIAVSILIVMPGPSVLLTVAHSLSFGWKRGLITVAGATAGIAVQLLLAVVGLSTVLKSAAPSLNG